MVIEYDSVPLKLYSINRNIPLNSMRLSEDHCMADNVLLLSVYVWHKNSPTVNRHWGLNKSRARIAAGSKVSGKKDIRTYK